MGILIDINAIDRIARAEREKFPTLRKGQALFNACYTIYPAIAEGIRDTTADPYYDDSKIPAFWSRLGEIAVS